MKLTTLPATLLLVCAGVAIGSGLARQDQDQQHVPGQPGPVHADMAKRAGQYTEVTEMRMGPGADPIVTHGATKIESILGGRFLMETGGGEMMGMKYDGLRIWGYNADTETFESVWMYTLGTSMMQLTGKANEKTGGVDWRGTWTDGSGEYDTRIALTFPDADTHVIEMYEKGPDGAEFVLMKSTYARVKK